MGLGKEEIRGALEIANENFGNKKMSSDQLSKRANIIWILGLLLISAFTLGGFYKSHQETRDSITQLHQQFEKDDKELQSIKIDLLLIKQREIDNKELLEHIVNDKTK